MIEKFVAQNKLINDYVIKNCSQESALMREIRETTEELPQAKMLSTPDTVAFICFWVEMLNVRSIIEVGTFTGYTTLAMAQTLPKDGSIITCDIKRQYTDIAEAHWVKSDLQGKIDLRIAPALDTLQALVNKGHKTDMIFIDANKGDYIEYYELGLKLIKDDGLMLIDNTLWGGSVADPKNQENITLKIKALNQKVLDDPAVVSHLLPIGDGLTFVKKV